MKTNNFINNKRGVAYLFLCFITQLCFGQQVTLPLPTYVFKFDKSDYAQLQDGKGTLKVVNAANVEESSYYIKTHDLTNSSFVSNRHGNAESAIKFDAPSERLEYSMSSDASAETFFGLSKKNSTHPNAFTLSFWVKYEGDAGSQTFNLFAAKTVKAELSRPKFGLGHSAKGLFLFKYIENQAGQVGDQWKYPLYTPAEFDAGAGWYFIMLVYDYVQKYTRIMIGKPNGGATYGPGTSSEVPGNATVTREFDGRLIWIPGFKPSLNTFQYWFTGGGLSGSGLRGMTIDDMKVYHESISLTDAKSIYELEKRGGYGQARSANPKEEDLKADDKDKLADEELGTIGEELGTIGEDLKLVPNPTSNITRIIFNVKEKGGVLLSIYDLVGNVLHSKQIEAQRGKNEIIIDVNDFNLINSLYFVEIQTPNGKRLNKKLLVKN